MKKKITLGHFFRDINIPLLVFLILFLNVKIVVKIAAMILIVLYYRNFQFGFSRKQSRLPLFYLLIIILEIFKYVAITRNYSSGYLLVFGFGMMQWIMSLLAIHHLKLIVERENKEKIHNTIRLFYLLNFAVSFFFLMVLIFHPAWLTWWGHGADISFSHPSAGDAILGISFDTSTINATVNCIGLVYFLYKKDNLLCFLCMFLIAICTSNTTFLIGIFVLVVMVLTVRNLNLRFRSLLAIALLTILYLGMSPKNRMYIRNYFLQLYIVNKDTSLISPPRLVVTKDAYGRLDSTFQRTAINDTTYKVDKGRLKLALSNLFTLDPGWHSSPTGKILNGNDSTIYPQVSETQYRSKPGKLISFLQTFYYLGMNARHMLFGAGMGNFSSKLAFRVSGHNVLGTFPVKYAYTSPEFRYNHLKTFLFYSEREASLHSVLNFPFSVYNQLLGEYGLIGTMLFVIFYLGYFVSKHRRLSYGRYMIFALLLFFVMEYWLELFSLVIVFELFLLLNIKESGPELQQASVIQPDHTDKAVTIPKSYALQGN